MARSGRRWRDLEFGGPIRTRRNPVYLGSAEETSLDRVLRYRQRRFEALAPIFLKSWEIHTVSISHADLYSDIGFRDQM